MIIILFENDYVVEDQLKITFYDESSLLIFICLKYYKLYNSISFKNKDDKIYRLYLIVSGIKINVLYKTESDTMYQKIRLLTVGT